MMNRQEAAEATGLRALVWVLGDDDQRGAFMAATGAAPSDLAAGAGDPAFLGAVLDFVLAEDARVIAFCTAEGLAMETPMQARFALPGGDLPHWT